MTANPPLKLATIEAPQLSGNVEPVGKVPNATEFKRDMSDDLPNSNVADQLHEDVLVEWLTDSDHTGFSNDLEKGAGVDEVPNIASRRVFLQPR